MNASESADVLACANLRGGYRDLMVVRDVSLRCQRGGAIGIMGANGCGKSTLFKLLAGVLPLSGGELFLGAEDVSSSRPEDRFRLGLRYLPQERHVFPSLTVRENLIIGEAELPRLDYVLELFPALGARYKTKAGALSGGERKMLGFGRCLMYGDVSLLLLDEPTAGLSINNSEWLWPTIERIRSEGVAVVMVEQRVEAIVTVADYCYGMNDGVVVWEGETKGVTAEDLISAVFLRDEQPAVRSTL